MVYVFFSGPGAWWSTELNYCDLGPEQVTVVYDACGVFRLTDRDAIAYRHTKSLSVIDRLLTCKHPDSEFVRAIKRQDIVMTSSFNSFNCNVDEECFYFDIFRTDTLIIAELHAQSKAEFLHNNPNKSDLTETERNTMLKLIIGMAIDAYGYDPDSSRNSATGDKNGISARLQTRDISITDDTIRKYLTEAKKLI